MLTKKVKNRILFLICFLLVSGLSTFFLLKNLNQNILYFKTPTEILQATELNFEKKIRLGGMVKKDSITTSSTEIKFIITDLKNEIIVSYKGTVPSLFLEEKGVVAEGKLTDKKFFVADRILAKHDENYMPPELEGILNKNAK
ncbi:cytochrome c maturation protein CcmE [Pelagibacteraceae bacterium]|nr:cytochrome c maturation protein CcmE [Pelagibacteraceae bacterium]